VITIRNSQHLARVLRHLRENAGITRRDLASRLFVTARTIAYREHGTHSWDTDSTIDTANIFGFEVALVPARRPGVRPTGTGWPT
jgi:transcriptional regulator with XRE-family HTH domain